MKLTIKEIQENKVIVEIYNSYNTFVKEVVLIKGDSLIPGEGNNNNQFLNVVYSTEERSIFEEQL